MRSVGAIAVGLWALIVMPPVGAEEMAGMTLTSPAFRSGDPIPRRHTCDDRDESPPLRWDGRPPGARSLVVIADDPDAPAGTWVHWLLYDLPADTPELPAGIPRTGKLPSGAHQGVTDFGFVGYGGPCPPLGERHRYYFRLKALDAATGLAAGATLDELTRAIKGHVLATAELMGTYER